MVVLDSMHVLDHHGVIVGSLLATCIIDKGCAPTTPASLLAINASLKAFYRRPQLNCTGKVPSLCPAAGRAQRGEAGARISEPGPHATRGVAPERSF